MKFFCLIFLFLISVHFIGKAIFLNKNGIKSKKHGNKFQGNDIIQEGWLKICKSPQKNTLIPIFRENPFYGVGGQKTIPNQEAFYFRLSGQNIFFTASDTDTKVLGALTIKKAEPLKNLYLRKNCFEVSNLQEKWILCSCSDKKEPWIDIITKKTIIYQNTTNKIEGPPSPPINNSQLPEPMIQTTQIIKQPILLIPLPSSDCSKGWDYISHGLDWQCRCKEGIEQSPIDLRKDCAIIKKEALAPRFVYYDIKKEDVKWVFEENKLKVKMLRPDIEMGRIYDYEGNIFQAYEIHFHTPSEHRIDGEYFDLEIQVIHKTIAGEFKNKAVLSLLYKKEPGAKVRFFQGVDMINLPNPILKNSLDVFKKDLNVYDLLDEDMITPPLASFSFFKYQGSFTTPPCEENVVWYVVSDVMAIGSTMVEILKDSLHAPKVAINDNSEEIPDEQEVCFLKKSILDGNYRELQNLNKREVQYFDKKSSCYFDRNHKRKNLGHYEKILRTLHETIWVPHNRPSGLPNSFVIPDEEAENLENQDILVNDKLQSNHGLLRESDSYEKDRNLKGNNFNSNEGKANVIKNINYMGDLNMNKVK